MYYPGRFNQLHDYVAEGIRHGQAVPMYREDPVFEIKYRKD